MPDPAQLLVCVSSDERRQLECDALQGARMPVTPRELDRALESSTRWSGLVASDGFGVAAERVASSFRERASDAPIVTVLDTVCHASIARSLELRAYMMVRPLDVPAVLEFARWTEEAAARVDQGAFRALENAVPDAARTPRERAVFAATKDGATKSEISIAAGVAVTTVKAQRKSAASKVGPTRVREIRRSLLERLLRRA